MSVKADNYQEFTIAGVMVDNLLKVRFKQPIFIPSNASIEVRMISYDFNPSAGYLNRGHSFSLDLPIKVQQTTTTDVGFERKILVSVPPAEQENLSVDDPAGIPATARRTYEPYTPIVHMLGNNEMSINEFTFKASDIYNQDPPTDDIDNMVCSFIIRA